VTGKLSVNFVWVPRLEFPALLSPLVALVHMSSPHSGVPDIPGALQYEPTLGNLKQYVANLLQMRSYRYVNQPKMQIIPPAQFNRSIQ
jgi:hypothetical protein